MRLANQLPSPVCRRSVGRRFRNALHKQLLPRALYRKRLTNVLPLLPPSPLRPLITWSAEEGGVHLLLATPSGQSASRRWDGAVASLLPSSTCRVVTVVTVIRRQTSMADAPVTAWLSEDTTRSRAYDRTHGKKRK